MIGARKIVPGSLFSLIVIALGCSSSSNAPPPAPGGSGDAGADVEGGDGGSGGATDSGASDGSGGADASCRGCPPPTCSISCIPHHIQKGGSTTYYWNADGTTCSLSCPGLSLALDVSCKGQDSSHFQNLQQTQTCTFTATGPGGTVSCSDDVVVQ